MFYDREYVSKYLDTLQLEINTYYQGEELDTIYIGGGTPSSLSDSELENLFSILSVLKNLLLVKLRLKQILIVLQSLS